MAVPDTPRRTRATFVIMAMVTLGVVGLPLLQSGGDVSGTVRYLNQFLVFVAIYGLITLGLNVHLGFARIMNFGVAAFFMVGAYAAALVVLPPSSSPAVKYVGGWGLDLRLLPALHGPKWIPFVVALVVAGAAAALLAIALSFLALRLGSEFLAIATIGAAESIRAIATVQVDLVNGDRGLVGIPRPFASSIASSWYPVVFLAIAATVFLVVHILIQRSIRSPYGRSLRAVREDEIAAEATGKDVRWFKLQAFVTGAVIMGVGGALYAWFMGGLSPVAFEPKSATFLFWIMLIIGGTGSRLGPIAGAYVIWGVWTMTTSLMGFDLPEILQTRMPALRMVLLGTIFILILLYRPAGLAPESTRVSRWAGPARRPGATA